MVKIKYEKTGDYLKAEHLNLYEIIKKYVLDKEVLDIGCAGNPSEKGKIPRPKTWLHGIIIDQARLCVGIDKDEKEVESLSREGYKILRADAENFSLDRKFDVIVAAWIICYVHPKLFLENIKLHIKKDGLLLISATNPFSIQNTTRILKSKHPLMGMDEYHWDDELICWYDPKSLCNLLRKNGFEIVDDRFYWVDRHKSGWWRLGGIWSYIWLKKDDLFGHEFLVVAKLGNR